MHACTSCSFTPFSAWMHTFQSRSWIKITFWSIVLYFHMCPLYMIVDESVFWSLTAELRKEVNEQILAYLLNAVEEGHRLSSSMQHLQML